MPEDMPSSALSPEALGSRTGEGAAEGHSPCPLSAETSWVCKTLLLASWSPVCSRRSRGQSRTDCSGHLSPFAPNFGEFQQMRSRKEGRQRLS